MSLILLFLPHQSTPSNQGAFTTAVIQSIETIRPEMTYVQEATGQLTVSTIQYSSPTNTYNDGLYGGAQGVYPKQSVMYSIDTTKPELTFVQVVEGVFQSSTVQYSSAVNTYNDGFYGGQDRVQPSLSTLNSIDSVRPTIDTIDKL